MSRVTIGIGLAIGIVVVLASCSTPAPPEASASKSDLGRMNRDFAAALNAKDAARAASLYAEDAWIIPPGEAIVKGRAAIEAYWKGAIESAGVRDVSVETLDARSSGDLGFEIGSYRLTADGPDGAPVKDTGRYIELLRRGADGTWISTAGIWNAAPEEPETE